MKISILTVSDTRDLTSDLSGKKIAELVLADGHKILSRILAKDEQNEIRVSLSNLTEAEVIIINGGTGIAKRDVTFEAVQPMIATEIPGFGEIFRGLSYEEIGSHALASRALAFFNASDQLIFCLPGSTKACQLAMEKLILPEMEHLINERLK